jgi:hypothetical protein
VTRSSRFLSFVRRALCVALGVLVLGASASPAAVTSLPAAEIAEWVDKSVAPVVSPVATPTHVRDVPPAPSRTQQPVPMHPEAPPTPPPEA